MNARIPLAACLLITICAPSSAGMIFREVSGSGSGGRDGGSRMVTEIMVEGGRARVTTIEAPDNPMIRVGSYMLAPGGDVMYMVNPAQRTYARVDLAEMRGLSQNAQSSSGPANMQREFTNVVLTQALDEAGPELLGLPTRHYKYTLAYVETMKVMGSPKPMEKRVRETHEFWTTLALPDATAAAKLAAMNDDDAGDSARRAVVEAEATMQSHGFVLRKIVNSESSVKMPGMMGGGLASMALGLGAGRSNDKFTTTREVIELREEKIADSMFALPAGFRETELFAPGAGGMPDLNEPAGERAGEPDLDAMPKR